MTFLSAEKSEWLGFILTVLNILLSFVKELVDIGENCCIRKKNEEKETAARNGATPKNTEHLEDKKKNTYLEVKNNFKHSRKACCMHILLFSILCGVSLVYGFGSELFFYEEAVGVSSTTINIHGAAKAVNPHNGKLTVWDADDVVTPAHATDQFFVRTKLIKTVSQYKTICSDEPSSLKPKCTSDDDCEFLKLLDYSDGYADGTCDVARGTCYVHAWCPVDTEPTPDEEVEEVLDGTGNFIVHINTSVTYQFKEIGLQSPNFNKYNVCLNKNDRENGTCPFLRVEDIVRRALENRKDNQLTFQDIVNHGGVFSIVIDWSCKYESSTVSPKCKHSYSFRFLQAQRVYSHIDINHQSKNSRHFRKEVGMLFFIEVHAKGKARSYRKLLLKSVIGFLALRSVGTFQNVLVSLISICKNCSKCSRNVEN